MVKNNKIIYKAVSFLMIMTLTIFAILVFSFSNKVLAHTNEVYFKDLIVETNDSNLIIAELVVSGAIGDTVDITYHTEAKTAIKDIDFSYVENTVSIKIDDSGISTYKISIKCLNDDTNRQKLRIYDAKNENEIYGRYFNLVIDDVKNASLVEGRDTCKCYLSYNYKVSASLGNINDLQTEEVAYISDYAMVQQKHHDGKEDIDGKETWKTWENGISFNNDTSKRWVNAYINEGLASAYTTYFINNIDSTYARSGNYVDILAGNKQLIDNYTRLKTAAGLYLYVGVVPEFREDNTLSPKAMSLIAEKKNPYNEDDDLIHAAEIRIFAETKNISWIQNGRTWYASNGSLVNSVFYKIDPYNGVLDTGYAIYNDNSEFDRKALDMYLLMTLVDDTTPTLLGEYIDDSTYKVDGKLRIILRFNEPVYSSKANLSSGSSLTVRLNNSTTTYLAQYVEGNYTDTLVYEFTPPKINITSLSYELPTLEIGDMAYSVNRYKKIENNKIPELITDVPREIILDKEINLSAPVLNVDLDKSTKYQNIYNIMLSINDNGKTDLNSGTVYYSLKKSQFGPPQANLPIGHDYSHTFSLDEMGSFGITLAKELGYESGDYYIYALAVSDYGLTSMKSFGPYRLDVDAPAVTNKPLSVNELQNKEFELEFKNKANGVALDNLTLQAKYYDSDGILTTKYLELVKDGIIPTNLKKFVSIVSTNNSKIYKYKSNIGDDVENEDTFILSLMADMPRLDLDISFIVTDEAGNTVTSNTNKVSYDRRDLFETSLNIPTVSRKGADGYYPITDIDLGIDVYDISGLSNNKDIEISVTNLLDRAVLEDSVLFSVDINGKEYRYASNTAPYLIKLDDLAGYYEITPRIIGVSSSLGTEYNLVSETYTFYLTNNLNDQSENSKKIDDNLVLINKVYQLSDVVYHYLDLTNTTVLRQLYGAEYDPYTDKYVGGSSSPTFSSIVEAKKYLKYMEYQDLYLVKISSNVASLLNQGSGTTTFMKAQGETVIAQEGQLWIRYKRSTWSESSNAYGWAFYYYGSGSESGGINLNGLSDNLNNAINTIVNRIASEGSYIYLVNEDMINQRTGAPYLTSSQLHIQKEVANTSKMGSSYLVKPTYAGDKKIYDNKVSYLNESYALATNMELSISPSSIFYYKNAVEGPWVKLDVSNGDILYQVLPDVSELFLIREYSAAGISEYQVYIDKSAPKLQISINENDPVLADLARYSGTSFVIKDLLDEIDPYGYVAIYTYPSKQLINVLYQSDIKAPNLDGYQLNSGNYYIQVGDRSGNIYTFIVLLSSSDLDVSVVENESKTAVTVKVNNRTEDEIYAYEIYLNEVLITTEFMPQRVFRNPGIYRIYIRDIYGNSYESVAEHDLQMPTTEWYYQTSNGGYAKYDELNASNMYIVKDSESPRTYNVYTSSLLRIKFLTNYNDSDIKYEVIGLSSDSYQYSKQFSTLTFEELTSFRIKIWYEDYPENSYVYNINVDNDAPNIAASFMGTSYYGLVEYDENILVRTSSFDYIDYAKYEIGSVITLDTLEYRTTGLFKIISFNDGNIINGSHIVLKITDMSDIKSYTVTRNGQEVTVELNSDNEIKLNGYGKYVVTVTDRLNNKATFTFTNIASTVDGLTTLLADEKPVHNGQISYGHGSVSLSVDYPGQTKLLITSGDVSETYIINFDGSYLTYGQYYCVYDDKDEANYPTKTSEFRTNPNFDLDINEASFKENYWYTMISNNGYVVYVKFENGLPTYKVENKEDIITVELLYAVNNIVLPERYVVELSKETPQLELLAGGETINVGNSNHIYISRDLTIGDVIDSNITKIQVGYSNTLEFDNLETVYSDGSFISDFVGAEDGFYQIVVENKYGNQKVYLIEKIDSLEFVIYSKYKDGMIKEYLLNDETIYSNSSIILSVFSDEIQFEVNGEMSQSIHSGGVATFELTTSGEYLVRAIGLNGLSETFSFVIASDPDFAFKDEWITGYNVDAILKEEGYTNKILSIEADPSVKYIEYKYNGLSKPLYDENNLDILENSIGNDGIGEYVIYFRNIYGDVVSKTIHYSNVPALKLSRKTVDEKETFTDYDLSLAMEKNFYSNYILRFETSSKNYIFTIDGNPISLAEAKSIEFSNASGNGSFGYHITYLDEYGNYVEFDAELYRKEVSIDTSKMAEINIDGQLYTKDNIQLLFEDGLEASLSVNGSDYVEYNSGQIYYKDGTYKFIIEDIAGNRNTYTIIHKSVNKYLLTDTNTEQNIINGSVVNNTIVVFESLDESTIQSVFKDGEKLESFNTNRFISTGHYEILVSDQIGNVSYSEFYLINNSLAKFAYCSPVDYVISEVWYTNDFGQRTLLLQNVEKIELLDNGSYTVIVLSKEAISSFNFSVEIDNSLPQAKLDGVEDGGKTPRDVRITNLKQGDKVEIYKDGKLVNVTVVSSSEMPPEINEGGEYRIVITNLAGAQIEYNFVRKQIANSATSIFIIITCFALIAGISIGLIYHTRLKTDS